MQSSYNKGRFDQPLQASSWLKNFKTSNERFLKEVCRACQVVLVSSELPPGSLLGGCMRVGFLSLGTWTRILDLLVFEKCFVY